MRKAFYFLPLLFITLLSTAIAALAACLLLKAEFIPGRQPYSYDVKTHELTIDIKVKVLHKDQTITSKPLKTKIPVDISGALDWSAATLLIDAAIQQEMKIKAQELCKENNCNK